MTSPSVTLCVTEKLDVRERAVVERAVQRGEVEVAGDVEAVRRHPVPRVGIGVGQAHVGPAARTVSRPGRWR